MCRFLIDDVSCYCNSISSNLTFRETFVLPRRYIALKANYIHLRDEWDQYTTRNTTKLITANVMHSDLVYLHCFLSISYLIVFVSGWSFVLNSRLALKQFFFPENTCVKLSKIPKDSAHIIYTHKLKIHIFLSSPFTCLYTLTNTGWFFWSFSIFSK